MSLRDAEACHELRLFESKNFQEGMIILPKPLLDESLTWANRTP